MTNNAVIDTQKLKIRNLVSTVYDVQKLRIATGNRICATLNAQLGQAPSSKQSDLDDEQRELIDDFRKASKRITDVYAEALSKMKKKSVDTDVISIRGGERLEKAIENAREQMNSEITDVTDMLKAGGFEYDPQKKEFFYDGKDKDKKSELKSLNNKLNQLQAVKRAMMLLNTDLDIKLVNQYANLLNTEEETLKILKFEVEQHPMWDAFFKDVRGCGPLMSAVCISYFDINEARHVSSFWKYAGLDTVRVAKEDGTETVEGRGMKHTEEREYKDKDGNTKTKRGLTYNPTLKTKLIGVLGSCFIKAGGKYREIYDDYKFRLQNRADHESLTPAHINNMAVRYMIKQFVRDMWVTWRALEGYEVTEPYEVAKLGYKPHKYNEYHARVAAETKK